MKIFKLFFLIILLSFFITNNALACACGCGVFNVGTSSLIPVCEGGMAFVQYDYINQNRNWIKESKVSADQNEDKQIKSQVVTVGTQYMFNRSWGAALRVPYMTRQIKMAATDDHGDEFIKSSRVNSLADVRLNGIYSGFFDDMSTGITFGLKLPTGQANAKEFDRRDAQIGTGSVDFILGAYHLGEIDKAGKLNWFMQANWQSAFIARNGYRPGDEISAASGISYNLGSALGVKKIVPIIQFTGSKKAHDTGWNSSPQNSGYSQGYFAPALELTFGAFKTYADIEFPLYQNVNGSQLTPTRIYKIILGYNF